jgi:hypothetical protein
MELKGPWEITVLKKAARGTGGWKLPYLKIKVIYGIKSHS